LKAISSHQWVEEALMGFIGYEKERSKKGEISVSTIPNYYWATKLFCEMNDLPLNWRKIARGLPASSINSLILLTKWSLKRRIGTIKMSDGTNNYDYTRSDEYWDWYDDKKGVASGNGEADNCASNTIDTFLDIQLCPDLSIGVDLGNTI
jgi:hypothetical protein